MKCPFCSAELAPDALSCPTCHAFQAVERTPPGVFSAWLGILASVLSAMILRPVPLMALAGISLKGFPWILPIIGCTVAAASFWYAGTTRHLVWLPRATAR